MKTRSKSASENNNARAQKSIQKRKKTSIFVIVPDSSDDESENSDFISNDEENDAESEVYTKYEKLYYDKLPAKKKREIDAKELLIKTIKEKQNEVPLRFRLMESGMPLEVISSTLDRIDITDGDDEKIYKFVENLMRIPFGRYSTLPVGPKSSPLEITKFLEKVQGTLDEQVFGMESVKKLFMVATGGTFRKSTVKKLRWFHVNLIPRNIHSFYRTHSLVETCLIYVLLILKPNG
jgi:hypothetical protein